MRVRVGAGGEGCGLLLLMCERARFLRPTFPDLFSITYICVYIHIYIYIERERRIWVYIIGEWLDICRYCPQWKFKSNIHQTWYPPFADERVIKDLFLFHCFFPFESYGRFPQTVHMQGPNTVHDTESTNHDPHRKPNENDNDWAARLRPTWWGAKGNVLHVK